MPLHLHIVSLTIEHYSCQNDNWLKLQDNFRKTRLTPELRVPIIGSGDRWLSLIRPGMVSNALKSAEKPDSGISSSSIFFSELEVPLYKKVTKNPLSGWRKEDRLKNQFQIIRAIISWKIHRKSWPENLGAQVGLGWGRSWWGPFCLYQRIKKF